MRKILVLFTGILLSFITACSHNEVTQYKSPDKVVQYSSTVDKHSLNHNCKRLCGKGYFYDRPGNKLNGQEVVCTKYPLDCRYDCTIGWNINYLVHGTNYTCQEAVQVYQ